MQQDDAGTENSATAAAVDFVFRLTVSASLFLGAVSAAAFVGAESPGVPAPPSVVAASVLAGEKPALDALPAPRHPSRPLSP